MNKKNFVCQESEMLTILMEECAEVTIEASKLIRFGCGSKENLERLEKEVGDLMCMIDLLHAHDMISWTNVDEYSNAKYNKLKQYSTLEL